MFDTVCFRCGIGTFELGALIVKVGKIREVRVTIWQCKNCASILYQEIKE